MFQWTWGGDILRFELSRTDGGTTMTFTTWLESADLDGASDAAGGYHVCLDFCRFSSTPAQHLHSSRARKLPDASNRNTRSDSLWASAQAPQSR